jgi:hypothetical protein
MRGGYLDPHNFRNRNWKPAQKAVGITPLRRVYDLRHTFATFASCRHLHLRPLPLHGHKPGDDRPALRPPGRDGRAHAIKLLDTYSATEALHVHAVDAGWTPNTLHDASETTERRLDRQKPEASSRSWRSGSMTRVRRLHHHIQALLGEQASNAHADKGGLALSDLARPLAIRARLVPR